MADSIVSIFIKGTNLTGGMWSGLRSQIGGVTSALSQMRGNFNATQQQTDGMTRSVGLLNAQFFLLTASVGVAVSAFAQLNRAGNEALQRQVEQVSALSTAMQTLGLSQQAAGRFTQGVETDIAKLGKELPTSAENIQIFSRTIQDDYAIALKGAGASLDQIKNAQLGSSSRLAILSDLAGGNVGASRAAVSAFLGGGVGAQGLNQYTFFGNNPLLLNSLKSGLAARGADSTGDLSQLERVKLFTEALEKSVTPEMIQLLQGTVKARLSSFMDSLFDPSIGLFSIQRDLEPKIDSYQSVFTAFGETLDILIGNNGIVSRIVELLGLGTIDPMRSLYDGVKALNSYLLLVSNTLNQMKKLTGADIGKGVGKFLADGVNVIFNGVLGGLAAIPYKDILLGVGYGIVSFFGNLDWKIYAAGAGILIAGALLGAVVPVIGVIAAGVISAVAGAFIGFPFLVAAAIGLGLLATVQFIRQNWDSVNGAVSSAFKKVYEVVESAIAKVEDALRWLFGSIEEKVRSLFTGITDNVIKPVVGGAASVVQNTGNAISSGASAAGNFFSGIGRFFGFGAANGFIPANMGLLGAIASEAANKPSNSDFVIANSSETILTPGQLRNLVGNLGGSKTVNFQPGAIVLSLPSGTPQQIAMEAIAIIEQSLLTELESKIA